MIDYYIYIYIYIYIYTIPKTIKNGKIIIRCNNGQNNLKYVFYYIISIDCYVCLQSIKEVSIYNR